MMRLSISIPMLALLFATASSASAQQTQSRLYDITKSGKLRVCAFTDYYAISYRDPASGKIIGMDATMAALLASELGVELQIVETSFATFVADIQANKCDVGMSGMGATLKRAQAIEFTKPYLVTGILAVTRKGGKISKWDDLDQPGIKVGVMLGSYIEPFMKAYLKQAAVVPIQAPSSRESELMAQHVDAAISDFPTALKVQETLDWADVVSPTTPLSVTPFCYAVPPGDQIWLNYLNLFIDTEKRNGKLEAAAKAFHLDPALAP